MKGRTTLQAEAFRSVQKAARRVLAWELPQAARSSLDVRPCWISSGPATPSSSISLNITDIRPTCLMAAHAPGTHTLTASRPGSS